MNVEKKIEFFKRKLHSSIDVSSRVLEIGKTKVGFVFLKSMTDNQIFAESIY